MRTPRIRIKYMLEARPLLFQAAARAVQHLRAGQELADDELLGVVATAQPELLAFKTVLEKGPGSEVIELSTITPVEAVLFKGDVELRRLV